MCLDCRRSVKAYLGTSFFSRVQFITHVLTNHTAQ